MQEVIQMNDHNNQPLRLIRVGDKVTYRFLENIYTVTEVREHRLTIKRDIDGFEIDADYADVRKAENAT